VPASRPKVWEAFLDPKVLKKAIPGCEKLEAVGPDEYKAVMKVGVGPVKGTFEGTPTAKCVLQALDGVKFPSFKSALQTVEYPFYLR